MNIALAGVKNISYQLKIVSKFHRQIVQNDVNCRRVPFKLNHLLYCKRLSEYKGTKKDLYEDFCSFDLCKLSVASL